MVIKNANKKELRKFGITVGIVFGIISAVLFYKEHDIYLGFALASGLLIISGTAAPILLKPIYRGWMTVAYALAWFNTRLILGALFYLIFTPISLIMHVFGRDALNRKIDRNVESYWVTREEKAVDCKRMERLY